LPSISFSATNTLLDPSLGTLFFSTIVYDLPFNPCLIPPLSVTAASINVYEAVNSLL
jgi:hypothetical protein